MSSINSISLGRLVRLIGTRRSPALVDMRPDEVFAVDPRLVPGSVRRAYDAVFDWAAELRGRSAVVICPDGVGLSAGWPRCCAMPAYPPRPGGWPRGMDQERAAVHPDNQAAQAQPPGPNPLGDAQAPENRPHRCPWLNGIARPRASRATGRPSHTRNDRSRQCQGAIPRFRGVSKCNDAAPSPP
jgi:hypothetical protein